MFFHYFKTALRHYFRNGRSTLLNIAGLSLGLAMSILLFLDFLSEYTFDHHHARIDSIYRVYDKYDEAEGISASTAMPVPDVLRDDFKDIDKFCSFWGNEVEIITASNEKILTRLYSVEPEVFEIFDFPFFRGSPEISLDDPNSAVITASFADRFFGDSTALGRTLRFEQFVFTVTGILEDLPENSIFSFDMLVSSRLRYVIFPDWKERWWHGGVYTFFIPDNPNRIPAINAMLTGIPDKYYPNWLKKDVSYFALPMRNSHLNTSVMDDMKPVTAPSYLYIMLSIALVILIIACLNYVNFATTQSVKRTRSIGISKVNGARRRSIIIQQLVESTLIVLFSLGIAFILIEQAIPVFTGLTGKTPDLDYGDPGLMAGLTGFALVIGILSGLYPGIILSGKKLVSALSFQRSAGFEKTFIQKGLVVLQFVATIALIICSLFIFKQLTYMKNFNAGFDKSNLLAIGVGQSRDYGERYREALLYRDEIMKHAPEYGLQGATITENIPGFYFQNYFEITPEGFTKDNSIRITSTAVDEHFTDVYGIGMAEGRFFSAGHATDRHAFIINETARKWFRWDTAAGKTIDLGYDHGSWPVVGVMKDIQVSSLHTPIEPMLFRFGQHNNFPGFITVRLYPERKEESIRFLRKTWERLFPDYSFFHFFVEDKYLAHYENESRLIRIIGIFTLLSVILSGLGLFSYVSLVSRNRTKEIGIRKANGARAGEIMLMLSKDFTRWIVISFAIACPVAWFAMNKWLQHFAFRTNLSWWVFLLGGLIAGLIALLTVSWQSRCAARMNPVKSLRYE